MTIEALKQLTEAFEIAAEGGGVDFYAYAKAGRQAIAEAEKDEPVGYWMGKFRDGGATLYRVKQESIFGRTYRNIPLYTHPQPKNFQPQDWSLLEATQESLREHMARIKKLAAQPKKPLTDEQIGHIFRNLPANTPCSSVFDFARAIEAAHGIKE